MYLQLIQQKYLLISISKTSMVKLNLFDFMTMDMEWYGWRFRIYDIAVFFYDDQNKLIPNGQRNKFRMDINFPFTFYDLDRNKEPQMFATPFPTHCDSTYSKSEKSHKGCKFPDIWKDLLSTSPNGTFVFRLENKQYLNLTQLHHFKVFINATMIERSYG